MNEQPADAKSASPLGEGGRIEVRPFVKWSESQNPHPTLSLEQGEATEQVKRVQSCQCFDHS